MKFIIDSSGNEIFEGSFQEIQQIYISLQFLKRQEILLQDQKLFDLLKDIKIGEQNETKNEK